VLPVNYFGGSLDAALRTFRGMEAQLAKGALNVTQPTFSWDLDFDDIKLGPGQSLESLQAEIANKKCVGGWVIGWEGVEVVVVG